MFENLTARQKHALMSKMANGALKAHKLRAFIGATGDVQNWTDAHRMIVECEDIQREVGRLYYGD